MSDDYNPFSEATMAEPSSAYHDLLAAQPVYFCEKYEPKFYTLSRYEDVETALLDTDTYSSECGQGPRFTPPAGMLSNPPQHTFFRSLVQQAFTPKAIKALSERVQSLADELADVVEGRDVFDVHDDFAFPLPVTIIAEMLGAPEEDIASFKKWSDSSVEAMGAEDPTPWEPDMAAMAAYIMEQVALRRAAISPGDDLITRLVQAEQDGETLGDGDILRVVTQLLVGGNETTTSLITNVVWRLLQDHSLWERLIAEPSLVNTAIEESLRFDPPVLGLYRTTTHDVDLHDVCIPENAKVMLHYAAANRDPEVFDSPDIFSLDRPPHRHLAFGLGVHFCLGSELARLEGRTALSTLVRRFPNLTLEGDGERIKPFFLWGRRRLPVRVGYRNG